LDTAPDLVEKLRTDWIRSATYQKNRQPIGYGPRSIGKTVNLLDTVRDPSEKAVNPLEKSRIHWVAVEIQGKVRRPYGLGATPLEKPGS